MWTLLLLACAGSDGGGDPKPGDDTAADTSDTSSGDTSDTSGNDTSDTSGRDTSDTSHETGGDSSDSGEDTGTLDRPSSGGSGGVPGSGTGTAGRGTYAWYAPDCLDGARDVAVVFTMHGSGGTGAAMVEQWRALAARECFLVVGLDSASGSSWNFNSDVTNFESLYEQIDASWDVAFHYLHGYSAGAHWTYIIGISNSEFFSGIGVWAGSLSYAEEWGYWPDPTEDPIPVAIGHGTDDSTVPYREATHAYDSLTGAGWPADLYTVEGGTHTYDPSCQPRAWEFWRSELD